MTTTTRARSRRSFVHDDDGAALLEFALIALVLLMLVFGVIDFGRVLYTANNMQSAAREGARWAAVQDDPAGMTDVIKDTVIAHASPLGGDALTRPEITVTPIYATSAPGIVQSIKVQVNYPVVLFTPISAILQRDTIRVSTAAQFRWELGL